MFHPLNRSLVGEIYMNNKKGNTPTCYDQGLVIDRNHKLGIQYLEKMWLWGAFSLARKGPGTLLSIFEFQREDSPPSW